MGAATLTRQPASEAIDTRPTEAALRGALTTDICPEHVSELKQCLHMLPCSRTQRFMQSGSRNSQQRWIHICITVAVKP